MTFDWNLSHFFSTLKSSRTPRSTPIYYNKNPQSNIFFHHESISIQGDIFFQSQSGKKDVDSKGPMHYLGLLQFVTMSTFLATCKVQKNLPTHPSLPSLSLCVSCLLPYLDFSTIWEQEAAFCVWSCVVLYRPVLIGPGKDGNYSRLGRNVSGLSLPFQRLEFSEAPHFQLLSAQD